MADVLCVHCGEPWDIYEFHDIAKQYEVTFNDIRSKFYTLGCGLFDGAWDYDDPKALDEMVKCSNEKVESDDTLAGIGVLQELLGDDIDGLSSTIDDFRAIGLM